MQFEYQTRVTKSFYRTENLIKSLRVSIKLHRQKTEALVIACPPLAKQLRHEFYNELRDNFRAVSGSLNNKAEGLASTLTTLHVSYGRYLKIILQYRRSFLYSLERFLLKCTNRRRSVYSHSRDRPTAIYIDGGNNANWTTLRRLKND